MRTVVAVIAAATLGLVITATSPGRLDVPLALLHIATGGAFAGAAAVVSRRPGGMRPATLLALASAGWFAAGLVPSLAFAHRGPLIHLLVGYPSGRLGSSRARVAVASGYAASLGGPLVSPSVVSFAIGAGLAAFGLARLLPTAPARRRRAVAALGSFALGGVLITGSALRLLGWPIDAGILVAYELALIAVAFAIGRDALARRPDDGLLTRLVIDLGDAGAAGSVRDRLARAVGDPDLVLAYPATDRVGGYVDEAGAPLDLPDRGAALAISPIALAGGERAVILHDPSVFDDPRSVALVTAATQVAMTNARLAAEIRARVVAVDASRLRLVQAGDAGRRRIEAEIRSGATRHIARAAELVAAARAAAPNDPELTSLAGGLAGASVELADFARGVHPELLTQGGLEPAIRDLASRASFDLGCTIDVPRLDPAVESTLYFVVAEALVNVAKHAGAGHVDVELLARGETVELTVRDDGRGGARSRPGGGIAGLIDRVEALGGSLVLSDAGRGTRLAVRVPTQGVRAASAAALPA